MCGEPAPARNPCGDADFRAFAKLFKQVIHGAIAVDREFAASHGLALTDIMCLAFLTEHDGPVSAKMLAEHVNLSTGATTALIDRLERDGFVERRPNPSDRRGVIIVPVEERAKPVLATGERLRHRLKWAYGCLSKEEVGAVARFFNALLAGTGPTE